MKIAAPFLYPVREGSADRYYEIVTQPMCLSDMREKVVSYQYETVVQVSHYLTLSYIISYTISRRGN
jgi:hypothetical protein